MDERPPSRKFSVPNVPPASGTGQRKYSVAPPAFYDAQEEVARKDSRDSSSSSGSGRRWKFPFFGGSSSSGSERKSKGRASIPEQEVHISFHIM
jgi:hypothetical protein